MWSGRRILGKCSSPHKQPQGSDRLDIELSCRISADETKKIEKVGIILTMNIPKNIEWPILYI